ncbi:MAG: HAD family hydrolase [bacterium]
MGKKLRFKAVCFDWGNTIEIGKPLILETVMHVWQKVIKDITYEATLAAAQDAWQELAKIKPNRKDLADMSEFRQMLYARQAELMANSLGVEPDMPDWPWVANVFFNDHYFKNRTWSIPNAHAKLLRKLRAANIPMTIIANNDDPAELPQLISDLGLTGFFEHEIASSTFGFAKPHPKIYLAALDCMDLRADEVLFVGDDYNNDYWGRSRSICSRCYLIHKKYTQKSREFAA